MEYLLLSVIALLISTISGDVEISFMKAVPRLNNLMYCDYYFACHAEGETLQWKVNNNNVSDYSGQSVGHVFTGSISTCNYTTTLLSLKPMPPGLSILDSVLIVSCQSSIDFDVSCTNGSVSSMTSSPEKGQNTRAESNITLVNLEHVLNANLVATDSSSCTNIFVCGVNNLFFLWQSQGNSFAFGEFDNIGMVRQILQDTTTVKQQAILIGNEPYSLVAVMIVTGSTEVNVTCGYPDNTANLVSISCSTNLGTTGLSTGEVGESSTMASESDNSLPLILGLSISLGCTVGTCCFCCISCALFLYQRYRRSRLMEAVYLHSGLEEVEAVDLPQISMAEPDSEIPLRGNFSKIKKPKKMMNIDYNEFFNRVQYIFLTRNESTFNAATTILTAPDIENTTNEQLTCIDEDVYIGMIRPYPIESHPTESHSTESHPVCLVNEIGSYFLEKLKYVIIKYFPDAKYIVFVGRCFGIDPTKLNLADIVISKSIRHADEHTACTELISPEIRSKFCFYPESATKYKVTQNRKAKPIVANIASGVNILNDNGIRSFAITGCDGIYGCEETSGELLSLFKTGINMEDNATKLMQIISIGAVTGYADKEGPVDEYVEWQFIASQAAFCYVASKMTTPHESGNILYEVKMPKPKRENKKFDEIKYIIITIGQDEFDAVTTYVSAPNLEEDIIEIAEDVYIGKIGSHSVGLLYLHNRKYYCGDMKKAIEEYFPHAEYLIHVGGCSGIDPNTTKLGDVIISEEIYNVEYDGISYNHDSIKMTREIRRIFCNSHNVEGLQLPGNRTAKHFKVRIATGTGADIEKDEHMKNIAIETSGNYGYDVVGGDIFRLQKKMKKIGRNIHFILINGVCSYGYSRKYDEWDFVASQAAIHYVVSKMKMNID